MEKKRELLSLLNKCIIAMSNMTGDVAKLEIMDNDVASRKIKRDMLNFKNNELTEFNKAIHKTRDEVRARPKRKISHNPLNNLAKTK